MTNCAECGREIKGRDDLRLIGRLWHRDLKTFHKDCAFSWKFKFDSQGYPLKYKTYILINQIMVFVSLIAIAYFVFSFGFLGLVSSIPLLFFILFYLRLIRFAKRLVPENLR